MDREWKRILNANPYYRIGRRSVTSDSSGYYTLTDLNSGSGDSAEYWYRVIAVSVNSTVYEETRLDQYMFPSVSTPQPQYLWYFEGTKIMALPLTATQAATIVVNWYPPRQELLSGDASTIDFPSGYENIISYSAGAMLLMKGAAEAGAAAALELQAEELRQDMLQDIMRRSTNPVRPRYADSVSDWGG